MDREDRGALSSRPVRGDHTGDGRCRERLQTRARRAHGGRGTAAADRLCQRRYAAPDARRHALALAVRGALGATYGAIVRLLTESALLGAGGGLLGLACAEALRRTLVALAPAQLPRADVVKAAGLPVGVAAAVSVFAVLLFGVVPAFVAVRRNPASPARLDARGGRFIGNAAACGTDSWPRRSRWPSSCWPGRDCWAAPCSGWSNSIWDTRPATRPIPQLSIPWAKYDSMPSILRLYDAIGPRLSAVPGVVAVTPCSSRRFWD